MAIGSDAWNEIGVDDDDDVIVTVIPGDTTHFYYRYCRAVTDLQFYRDNK